MGKKSNWRKRKFFRLFSCVGFGDSDKVDDDVTTTSRPRHRPGNFGQFHGPARGSFPVSSSSPEIGVVDFCLDDPAEQSNDGWTPVAEAEIEPKSPTSLGPPLWGPHRTSRVALNRCTSTDSTYNLVDAEVVEYVQRVKTSVRHRSDSLADILVRYPRFYGLIPPTPSASDVRQFVLRRGSNCPSVSSLLRQQARRTASGNDVSGGSSRDVDRDPERLDRRRLERKSAEISLSSASLPDVDDYNDGALERFRSAVTFDYTYNTPGIEATAADNLRFRQHFAVNLFILRSVVLPPIMCAFIILSAVPIACKYQRVFRHLYCN